MIPMVILAVMTPMKNRLEMDAPTVISHPAIPKFRKLKKVKILAVMILGMLLLLPVSVMLARPAIWRSSTSSVVNPFSTSGLYLSTTISSLLLTLSLTTKLSLGSASSGT